jgi:rare lipoprotein A
MREASLAPSRAWLRHAALPLALSALLSACSVPVHRPAPAPRPQARPAAPAAEPQAPTPPVADTPAQDAPLSSSPATDGSAVAPAPPETGLASWYGGKFHGRRTASGERYDKRALTAAHRTLPFQTRVKVRNLENGRELVVRITDRGPFAKGRIIDLSQASAQALGVQGLARVSVERLEAPALLTSDAKPTALAR